MIKLSSKLKLSALMAFDPRLMRQFQGQTPEAKGVARVYYFRLILVASAVLHEHLRKRAFNLIHPLKSSSRDTSYF